MSRLDNRISFITGATSGIGEACAYALAELGSHLIISGRRNNLLETIAEDIHNKFNVPVQTLQLDVRSNNDVVKKIENLPDKWKNIDILVNNAGLASGFSKLHEGDLDDWEAMIDTNVKGLLYVSRAIIPMMVKRNRGHIVNIGSTAGHEVYANGNVYCATKHAVDALTKGMRIDLVDTPIRVSTVDPGLVETEFSIVRFKGNEDRAKSVYEGMTPLTGDDIADIVAFIVTRPSHVQIAETIVMATSQAAATTVHRENK